MIKPVYVCCAFNIYADFSDEEFVDESPEERRQRKEWRGHVAGFTPDEAHATTYRLYDKSCDVNWYLPAYVGDFPIVSENGRNVIDGNPTCPRCDRAF